LIVEGLFVLAALVVGYLREQPAKAGAIALDRHHKLHDRLSSALSFSELPQTERTPFMDAAIDDALTVVATVDPRKAAPIKAPRDWGLAVGLGIGVAILALFESREHKRIVQQDVIDPVQVTPD